MEVGYLALGLRVRIIPITPLVGCRFLVGSIDKAHSEAEMNLSTFRSSSESRK